MDSSTHPRSEVLGGNPCIQTSRTPTYIVGVRTFIHVYILSTAKFPERFSNKQQTLLFLPTKTDIIARRQINPHAKIQQKSEITKIITVISKLKPPIFRCHRYMPKTSKLFFFFKKKLLYCYQ